VVTSFAMKITAGFESSVSPPNNARSNGLSDGPTKLVRAVRICHFAPLLRGE
jgi:hypothetical protein